jgi:integrase
MTKKALTDRTIKAQKPEKIPYDVGDSLVPGLALRVMPSGTRSFVLVTRFPGSNNPTRRSLGAYGELTLEQAREKARGWLALIKRGTDPAHEEERQRQAALRQLQNSFNAVAEEFIKRHVSRTRKAAVVERELRREFMDRWGERPITDITQHDVVAVIDAAVDRGARYQAFNLLGHVRSLFNWAIGRGVYGLDRSPCDRLRPKNLIGKKLARQRVLSDAELRAFWEATETMRYPWAPLFQLLLITGQRKSEVGEARWSEFNLEKREWVLPPERMKAESAHVVPLSDEAVKILAVLPRLTRGDYLFSTTFGAKPVAGFSKAKALLDKEMAKHLPSSPAPFVIHDIRRTVRTGLSSLPVPDIVRELVIAHSQKGLHKVYDQHKYDAEKRHALDLWAAKVRDIVIPPPANVVKMRSGTPA